MQETPIEVLARNDTTQTFFVSRYLPGAETSVPYDLTGTTQQFFIKTSAAVADPAPLGTPTVVDATGGELTVFLADTDIPAPGVAWYHLDVIDGASHRTTVAFGPLTVRAV